MPPPFYPPQRGEKDKRHERFLLPDKIRSNLYVFFLEACRNCMIARLFYLAILKMGYLLFFSGGNEIRHFIALLRRFWCKFHFKTQQGIKCLTDAEAEAVIGKCRESNQRDLYYSIEKGDFPRWTLSVQIMTEEQAANHPYNPFDLTKVWYKKDYPFIEVGFFELNKNPENYFAEVEQSAFNPANVVPGISFSPDKMLQGRLFSYGDTQRYRLGVNHHLIPVNKARCPFHSYHRDGQMRVDGNYGSTLGYEPNSYDEWQEQPDYSEPPLELSGAATHWNAREDDSDYYTQPGKLFHLMTKEQQEALFGNTARAMGDAPEMIKIRHIGNCLKADPAYGEGVANALEIPLSKVPK